MARKLTEQEKEGLLQLFCKYKVTEITGARKKLLLNVVGVIKPGQLTTIEGYDSYFNSILEVAERINEISLDKNHKSQVRQCLELLSFEAGEVNIDVVNAARKLINARLFDKWSPQLRNRYKAGEELIFDWVHFFISYTNSSRPAVNVNYRSLLKNNFSESFIKQNSNKMNLVPAVLFELLKMQRLKPFYDKEILDWGDDFKEQIFGYSCRTFGFIQLVETEIFVKNGDENYCYREYQSYKKSMSAFSQKYKVAPVKPLYLYIVSNPQNKDPYIFAPKLLPNAFKEWESSIQANEYVTLHQKMSREELKYEIQQAADKIIVLQKKIFDNYLASI